MSIQMRYRWTKDETLRYRMVNEATTTIAGGIVGVSDLSFRQTMNLVFSIVVQDTGRGTTTLLQSIDSLAIEMGSALGAMRFDSTGESTPNSLMEGVFASLIGEPLQLALSPTGTVQRVDGFDRLLDGLSQKLAKRSDSTSLVMLNALQDTFSDDAWRSMWGRSFVQFPERPVRPGETWTTQHSIRLPMMGGLPISVAAILRDVDGRTGRETARIATRLTMAPLSAVAVGGIPNVSEMHIGEASGEGEIEFDVTAGRVLRSTMHSSMRWKMSGTGPDGGATTLRPHVKSTMTMGLVDS